MTGLTEPEVDPPATAATQRLVLELAVTAAGVGTFDWDLRADVLRWDDRLLELFGYDRSDHERPMAAFYERLHPDDRHRVARLVARAVEERGTYEAEYRVVLPGGGQRFVVARGRVLTDPDGAPAHLLGAAHDLTARRDTEALVARVMDSMSLAFFALDRDWRFTYLNAEAEHLLGRRADELLGRDVWEQFPAAVGSDFETFYRRAAQTGEPAAFDAYYPEPLNAWYEVRAVPGPDGLAVYFLDVTERRRAREEAERALGRAGLLSRVTERLVAAPEPFDAVRDLSRLLVPALADWCALVLVDADQPGDELGLHHPATWHARPELRAVVQRFAEARLREVVDTSVVQRVLDRAEPVVLYGAALEAARTGLPHGSESASLLDTLAPASIAVFPLTGREQPVGVLLLANAAERGRIDAADLELARDVAARTGLVLDRARLHRRQRDVAEGLQRSLLTEPPRIDHLEIAVRYAPAAEAAQVGGDWYDAFLQADGSATLVIGDVMGHALAAAAAMGQIRTLVRGVAALHGGGPAAVLSDVERVLRTLGVVTTATALVARIRPVEPTGPGAAGRADRFSFRWSNAGHPPPVLVGPGGAVSVLSRLPTDLLLGVDPSARRREHQVELAPGATVVLFTDGLVERRGQAIDVGLDRLAGLLRATPADDPEALCDALLAGMLPERPEDDVALVAVRVRPPD